MAETGESRRRARWAAIVFWASVLVFLVSVGIGASGGVRGSDQYWYLDDTETLLRGDPPFSNCLYPRQLLAGGIERSPLMHDILPQRAVVPLARAVGPYWSWIVMNAVAMVAAAGLTYVAARRLGVPRDPREPGGSGDPLLAAWAGALVLLLPLSIFGASQVLSECSIVPMLAATIALLERRPTAIKYVALSIVLTLAAMSRITMAPLAILLPLAPLVERVEWRRRIGLAMLSAGLIIGGHFLNKAIFAGIPIKGNSLVFGINGRGMSMWLSAEPVVFSFDALRAKLEESVTLLFAGSMAMRLFNATSWILMLASLAGAVVCWRRGDRLTALAVAAVMAVNVATLALYQNQIRYMLPTIPVLIVASAALVAWLSRPSGRGRTIVTAITLMPLAGLALAIAAAARAEGFRERAVTDRTTAAAAALTGEGDVIYVGGNDQMFAHALRPRTVLFVNHPQPKADWDRILAMPRWKWVFAEPGAIEALEKLGVKGEVVAHTEHRGVPYVFMRIR